MGLSVSSSTLHVLHKLSISSSKIAEKRNKMNIGGKKLRFILSNYSFKGNELSSI